MSWKYTRTTNALRENERQAKHTLVPYTVLRLMLLHADSCKSSIPVLAIYLFLGAMAHPCLLIAPYTVHKWLHKSDPRPLLALMALCSSAR